MLPIMKNEASGDHARSYISVPSERHMCFVRHVSLSSRPSAPKVGWWVSDRTHKITFPSSPADARSSPRGCQLTFGELGVPAGLAHLSGPSGRRLPPGCVSRGLPGSRPSGLRHPLLPSTTIAILAPRHGTGPRTQRNTYNLPEHCCLQRRSPDGLCRSVRSGPSRSDTGCYCRGAS